MNCSIPFMFKSLLFSISFSIMLVAVCCSAQPTDEIVFEEPKPELFRPDHSDIEYIGRVDFTNPMLPRFWAPGVYMRVGFTGKTCEVLLNDEMLWGNSHNYVSVVIDDQPVKRIKLTQKVNSLRFDHLGPGNHTIVICKSTESGVGFLEFAGIKCESILAAADNEKRAIEFIGNSITCGMGSDQSVVKCDKGVWYDQHNAYMSYAAQAARSLNAKWMLTSVSGIGLIHSCCDITLTMPDVYDKINLRENKDSWNFSNYSPDVVTICLGQNDGVQDSTLFCAAYVKFIETVRNKYAGASIICLTSPMADSTLGPVMKKYLSSATAHVKKKGDMNVSTFFFSRQFKNGCGSHPTLEEHAEIAAELAAYIKNLKNW
jgi:hypothetical protein